MLRWLVRNIKGEYIYIMNIRVEKVEIITTQDLRMVKKIENDKIVQFEKRLLRLKR